MSRIYTKKQKAAQLKAKQENSVGKGSKVRKFVRDKYDTNFDKIKWNSKRREKREKQ